MTKSMWFVAVLAVGLALLAGGCGSSEETVQSMSVEDRFAHAKALFDDRDYLDAVNEFTVITLQYQGSAHAADAQFYLGDRNRMRAKVIAQWMWALHRAASSK